MTAASDESVKRRESMSFWGLEIMIDLVRANRLPREDVIEVAEAIQAANPFHVAEEILEEFRPRTRS